MRHERVAQTPASRLLLLAAFLSVVATGLMAVSYELGWSDIRIGTLGWLGLLSAVLAGSMALAHRLATPLKRLEERALELAAGDQVETRPVADQDEVWNLLEAFNSVARRVNLLTDTTELLAAASDHASVMAGLASALAGMLEPDDGAMLLLQTGGEMRVAAAAGALSGGAASGGLSAAPWLAEALASHEPTRLRTDAADTVFGTLADSELRLLAAPLLIGHETVGATVVVRPAEREFSDAEQATLRSFAAQASLTLHNLQLFDEERRSRGEAETLRRVAELAAAVGDPRETLEEIARMQCELVGLGRWRVILYDRGDYGLSQTEDPAGDRAWRMAWDAMRREDAAGDALYVEAAEAPLSIAGFLADVQASGAILTPLQRSGAITGFIVLLADAQAAAPTTSALELAGTVGRQASLVLENAYLYQQAKSRADNLETIFRISTAVGSSLQSRVVLNRVMDVVQKILSADAALLMQYEPHRRLISSPMARGAVSSEMMEATFSPGEDVPGRVFETHEPERYDYISGNDTLLLNLAGAQGLESLLAVPLLARGRSIGVLAVFSREPAAFSSEELHLLRTFAAQAALAIDNAEMFSREHEMVRVLQESILPTRLADIPAIEAGSIYVAAGGADIEIGGDYYDLYTGPDGHVVIAMGDVCGKGVNAATKTSLIRHAIRGMIVAGLEPARILAELNELLLESGAADSIVTLWLGKFDTHSGRLVYADGGHPPALLLGPDRSIARLGTTGALLGAVAGAEWEERSVRLLPESLLLLYTDGVTEARRANKFFGEGRVRRVLRAGGSATEVAERLLGHVQRYCGGETRDDAAILAVRYVPFATDE